jgi:geranylgeranyl pyrophosphate synthase
MLNFAQIIDEEIKTKISQYQELYSYALSNGKFFRARLSVAIYKRFAGKSVDDLKNFVLFLEFHHAYTLIHDDLPCMDDGKIRRGKMSHHLYFNEYLSLLTGDALLNLSYEYLTKIVSHNNLKIIRLATKMLGANGLILGQIMDLEKDRDVLKVYYLKTARLIQMALLGAYLMVASDFRVILDLFILGKGIGLMFQLLDDLDIANDRDKNSIWSNDHALAIKCFQKEYKQSFRIIAKYNLEEIDNIVRGHFLHYKAFIASEHDLFNFLRMDDEKT